MKTSAKFRLGMFFCVGVLGLLTKPALSESFIELQRLAGPGVVEKILFSERNDTIIWKDNLNKVVITELSGRKRTSELRADYRAYDIALSPDETYVFATDFGAEQIGYGGTPVNPQKVRRLNLTSHVSEVRASNFIAGHIQAISDDRIVLKTTDQWITMALRDWSSGTALEPANTQNPSQFCLCYYGNFVYDSLRQRLIHGNSGSSSQEITSYTVAGDVIARAETTGTYGTASGYGGSAVLSQDGRFFFYGALQVRADDIDQNVRVFPETIYAATSRHAFGKNNYYDINTGAPLGNLPFQTTIYALASGTNDIWAYNPATWDTVRFTPSDDDQDGMPVDVELSEGRNPDLKDNLIFAGQHPSSDRWFVMQQYRDILGREADALGLAFWTSKLATQELSRRDVSHSFMQSQEFQAYTGPISRLYFGVFDRVPDIAGQSALQRAMRGGRTITQLAGDMIQSREFQLRHGQLTNSQFVSLMYNNVLGRSADFAGFTFWLAELDRGRPREVVLVSFTESQEYKSRSARKVLIATIYQALLRRSAEPSGFEHWVNFANVRNDDLWITERFLISQEYRNRFLPAE